MKKIIKLFKALALVARKPALLNRVLDDEDVNRTAVLNKFNLVNGLPVVNYHDLIQERQTISPFCAMEGGSTPIDLALLKGLALKFRDCTYFEIGTWRGESVANVASVAKQCVSLNLSDDELKLRGLPEKYIGQHRFFSKNIANVRHIFGNSLSFDYSEFYKSADLVFIDGDHHYESVRSDTENAFKLIKDENSIIAWHDYGHDPSDIRWDVLRGILEGCPPDERKFLYRVSNTLCAIYSRKKIESRTALQNENPNYYFNLEVESHKL